MIAKFLGDYEQTVDGKGRVSVPSAFRRVVEIRDPDWTDGQRPNMVIIYGGESWKRLDCYPIDEINKIYRGIERMKRGSPDRQRAEKLYYSRAIPAQIIEDGRLLLPLRHRERLGLDDKAKFVGLGDHFQIWKAETYQDTDGDDFDAWLDSQPDDFDMAALIPDLDDEDQG